jgi:hypothetical protein
MKRTVMLLRAFKLSGREKGGLSSGVQGIIMIFTFVEFLCFLISHMSQMTNPAIKFPMGVFRRELADCLDVKV